LICTTHRLLFVRPDAQPTIKVSLAEIASVKSQSHPPDGQVTKIAFRSGGESQFLMSRRNADIIKKAIRSRS
jgi:hypothetical protein